MRWTVAAATIALALFQVASGQAPLVLVQTIELPNVEGRIDHLAADVAAQRLYVAALGNNTVEVLDLKTGTHAKSLAGFREPQGIAVVADASMVAVANGQGDGVQLEQLLINLVRNAVDASLEAAAETGAVEVSWAQRKGQVEVWIRDEGPGLANTTNLFVPFFTTKVDGSGIGLVLSRQIAEAHGGTLTLENRAGHRGCEAVLRLPL